MTRRKCLHRGHRWVEAIDAFSLPVQFCSRWRCGGRRPAPWLPPKLRGALQREIDREERA